ncbi:glycoside hydrolase [Catenovulum agarivorans DS-2]|uniref:Glycoside hydrolase n=1 Tax=Catenovulum agarivorans DS-2 TaxID=1328313 RepID=W7QX03_9ALTE|nr:family 43 glycosylhydrolase [Catenovulum agarivorans]EWH09805.1 glycoside hydrolase [Catenovulum agarivorans DS-2]
MQNKFKLILGILFLTSLAVNTGSALAKAHNKLALLKKHNQAFNALDEMIRDPFIKKGPDNYYYLIGTTSGKHWGDKAAIRLWRSKNLVEWQNLGLVWQLHVDGKQQNSWHYQKYLQRIQPGSKAKEQYNPVALWAPEIHFMQGTWWIPHSTDGGGHGLLKSTSGLPQGPYQALPAMMQRNIDSHLYQEGEDIYYAWQADFIAKMNADMTALVEPATKLKHQGNHEMGYEGILIEKVADKYLHIASGRYGYEPTDTYDLYYAVSKNLKGPYGQRRMMVKNAGHGNLIQDPYGKWWVTAFDHEYVKQTGGENRWNLWLVPIEFKVTEDDVIVNVLDQRFAPTKQDQAFVEKLAIEGKPTAWHNQKPWTLPKQLDHKK